MATVDRALEIASRYPIFPCRADKTPCTPHGFKDASKDAATIRKWWAQYPNALIGQPTGATTTFVVDLDVKDGTPARERARSLFNGSGSPLTTIYETASGGWHIHYKSDEQLRTTAGVLAPFVDTRGEGGYCVRWDAEGYRVLCDEPPAPIPGFLAERLRTRPRKERAEASPGEIHEGGRNSELASLAGTMQRRGMSEAAILAALHAENEARCVPPLPLSDVEAIAASIARYEPEEPFHAGAAEFAERFRRKDKAPDPNAIRDAAGPFTEDELASARLTPTCIVKDYLYCNVAALVAEGGAGKTTLTLHEAVCIVLGRPVWGLETVTPGWVLFITAEDEREQHAARVREMLAEMSLTPDERARALAGVRTWDVVGENIKLVRGGPRGIEPTDLADRIVEAFRDNPPILINIDPMVSFGASEQAANDNEQRLVEAARRIMRGLGCCVRLIHHVGKSNAANKSADQYAGRGGSALPDGCRMVAVLTTEPDPKLPWGSIRNPRADYVRLSRPKVSYAPKANRPDIFVERDGWGYSHYVDRGTDGAVILKAHADQLERFLCEQLKQGRRYTGRALEMKADDLGMSRTELRKALEELRTAGRVFDAPLPKDARQGLRKSYLHPAAIARDTSAQLEPDDDENDPEGQPP